VLAAVACGGAALGWAIRTAEVRNLREALEDAKRFIAVETVAQVPAQPTVIVMPEAISAWERMAIEEEEEEARPVAAAPAPESRPTNTVDREAPGNPWGGAPQNWNDPAQQAARQAAIENWMQQAAADTRQNIIEQGGLDEDQVMELDTMIGDLNQQVTDIASEWADYIREVGALDADSRMRMMHDISKAMVIASDRLDQCFPEWRNGNPDLIRLIGMSASAPFQRLREDGYRIRGMGILPGFGGGQRPPNGNSN